MSGSSREALLNVRMCGRTSQLSGSGRVALSDVRECSEGPTGCSGIPLECMGVVERLSQISRSG